MHKQTITKEDGRYLIYYTFGPLPADSTGPPPAPPAAPVPPGHGASEDVAPEPGAPEPGARGGGNAPGGTGAGSEKG
jgi:hypothetical protein